MGILYEHPEWFKLLFAELTRRQLPFEPLYVDQHWFDPAAREAPYSLVVNRVSPSSYLRGHTGSILYTRQVLAHLRDMGTPVVNGYEAFTLETSKALQLLLFERLGIRYPRARVINHPTQLVAAAQGLVYPVIVKPNVGGSGALMQRFESPSQIRDAAQTGSIDFGIDRTALVQEYLAPEEGAIVRVEVLNGEFLYAIKIFINPDEGFNLCPADICRTDAAPSGASALAGLPGETPNGSAVEVPAETGAQRQMGDGEACDFGAAAVSTPGVSTGAVHASATQTGGAQIAGALAGGAPAKKPLRIEPYSPPRAIIEDAIRLVRGGNLDIGGVEYLVSARDGQPYFYDVNALSNFVTDAPMLLGFDPTSRFVDYLAARAGTRQLVTA